MKKSDKIMITIIVIAGTIAALLWYVLGRIVELIFLSSVKNLCFTISLVAILLVVIACIGGKHE